MTRPDLSRFVDAQEPVYETALAELRRGRKRSHWMWFVFPQIAGLGMSATSRHFAIRDLDEARAYLADPLLGVRLRESVAALMAHADEPATAILGGIDAVKLRSCLTLFLRAASCDEDRGLLHAALAAFYDGGEDEATLRILGGQGAGYC